MDIIYFKLLLLLNGWLLAEGSPVAMLQHATSSQSIVFHTGSAESSNDPSSSDRERHGTRKPHYEYKYEVSDQQTGDRKSHWETREGDRVRGVYTLYEADGALRTVEYTADATHGFNAVVKRNEPNKRKFSSQTPFSQISSNGVTHHDRISSNQILDRSPSTNSHSRNEPNYSGNNYNPGVDFSVSHVLKKY